VIITLSLYNPVVFKKVETMKRNRIVALFTIALLAFGAVSFNPSTGFAKDTNSVDEAFDLYWAKKRAIRVIQKRQYLKENRIELFFQSGVIPNDDFWLYMPIGAGATYFISEAIGIELEGSYVHPMRSELKGFLEDNKLDVGLPQYLVYHGTLSGMWSPAHGKIGFFSSKLVHFDLSFSFGIGVMGTMVDRDGDGKEYEHAPTFTGALGTAFRLWFSDNIAMRVGYRHYFHPADQEAVGGGVSFPAEFFVGASFLTGGTE